MWTTMSDGVTYYDTATGEEIYINLGKDGLFRVYRDKKIIFVCHSASAANEFIEKHIEKLNEEYLKIEEERKKNDNH